MTTTKIQAPRAGRELWRLRPDTLAERWSRGTWTAAAHHIAIADAVVDAVARPDGRLIIEAPPRHGKSEEVSHWTPAWFLQLCPWARVLLASYGASLAAEYGSAVRDTLIEHGDEVGVRVARGSRAKNAWRTTAGGGMWTAGIGGTMTGRGGNLVLIDDPVKNFEDAASETKRQTAWNWYLAVARTRLAPGATIIVIQTRWNEDDLAGRLQKESKQGTGDHYEVLTLPAIAEHDERHVLTHVDRERIRVWTRRKGEALWPAQYAIAAIEATRKALGSYIFGALYQQKPAPAEGGIVKREWIRTWTALPAPHERDDALISVDSSFKDKKSSDYVVMQVWWRFGSRKFLIRQIRDRMSYVAFRKALAELAVAHPECRAIFVEDSANGPAVIDDLKGNISGLIAWPAKGTKEARLHAVSPDFESGNVYVPDPSVWHEYLDYVNELVTFPNAANDDQVDATSQALLQWPNYALQQMGVRDPWASLRGQR